MDQKNTIVKCKAYPNCLFNHNGVCDNYVINIGEDGKCDCYVETEPIRGQKTCQDDCIHFDDSDPMVGPICLFNHPEPLKEFYKDMPCDYYHSTNYTRGQRANCNIYDDACDASFLKEDLEKIQQTLEQDFIPCTMKVAELNKPNKNKTVISDYEPFLTKAICSQCKYDTHGHLCSRKNVVFNGI